MQNTNSQLVESLVTLSRMLLSESEKIEKIDPKKSYRLFVLSKDVLGEGDKLSDVMAGRIRDVLGLKEIVAQ